MVWNIACRKREFSIRRILLGRSGDDGVAGATGGPRDPEGDDGGAVLPLCTVGVVIRGVRPGASEEGTDRAADLVCQAAADEGEPR